MDNKKKRNMYHAWECVCSGVDSTAKICVNCRIYSRIFFFCLSSPRMNRCNSWASCSGRTTSHTKSNTFRSGSLWFEEYFVFVFDSNFLFISGTSFGMSAAQSEFCVWSEYCVLSLCRWFMAFMNEQFGWPQLFQAILWFISSLNAKFRKATTWKDCLSYNWHCIAQMFGLVRWPTTHSGRLSKTKILYHSTRYIE